MNYILQNIYIYKGHNSRGDYYWAQGNLWYEEDPFDNPAQLPIYPILTPQIVDAYRKVATPDPTANPQYPRAIVDIAKLKEAFKNRKFEDGTPLEFDPLHVRNVFPHVVKLTGIWGRIATRKTEVPMLDGSPKTVEVGQFIPGKNGTVTPITELRVYIKNNADGNPVDEPSTVVNRLLERRYKPLPVAGEVPINRPKAVPDEPQKSAEDIAKEEAQKAAEDAALGNAF